MFGCIDAHMHISMCMWYLEVAILNGNLFIFCSRLKSVPLENINSWKKNYISNKSASESIEILFIYLILKVTVRCK